MSEYLTFQIPDYNGEILQPDNARFMYRVLEQTTLRDVTEGDLQNINLLGQALRRQLLSLNTPYFWYCILSTYSPINSYERSAKFSEENKPFMDDTSEIVVNGIIWGAEELTQPISQDTIKTNLYEAISGFSRPVQSLEQFIERTERLIGNPHHTGLLEETFKKEEIELLSSHRAMFDVLRIYGRGFARQFQAIA